MKSEQKIYRRMFMKETLGHANVVLRIAVRMDVRRLKCRRYNQFLLCYEHDDKNIKNYIMVPTETKYKKKLICDKIVK